MSTTKVNKCKSSNLTWVFRPLELQKNEIIAHIDMAFKIEHPFVKEHENQELEKTHYVVWWYLAHKNRRHESKELGFLVQSAEDYLLKPYYSEKILGVLNFTYFHYFYWQKSDMLRELFDIVNSSEDRIKYISWLYMYGINFDYPEFSKEIAILVSPYAKAKIKTTIPLSNLMYIFWYSNKAYQELYSLEKSQNEVDLFMAHILFRGKDQKTFLDEEILLKIHHFINPKLKIPQLAYLYFCTDTKANELITCGELKSFLEYYEWFKENRLNNDEYMPQNLREAFLGLYTPKYNSHSQYAIPSSKIEEIIPKNLNLIGLPYGTLGLGEDLKETWKAISQLNLDCTVYNYSTIIEENPIEDKTSPLYHHVTNQLTGNVNLYNLPLITGAIIYYKMGRGFFEGKYNIACAPWEFNSWNSPFSFLFNFFEEFWCISHFVKEAYQEVTKKPVVYMPHSVELPDFVLFDRETHSLPRDKFLYFFMFDANSGIERKNPFAIIECFQKAFPKNQDVGLVIKAIYASNDNWKKLMFIASRDHRIIVINEVMSKERLLSLFSNIDVFVSLHRSEGFGRCLAEAMLLKKPVIATGYSGNTDFCTDETAFLVDYKLKDVKKGEYRFAAGLKWADVKIDSAIEQFKQTYTMNKNVLEIIEKAFKKIDQEFNNKCLQKRILNRLSELGFKFN